MTKMEVLNGLHFRYWKAVAHLLAARFAPGYDPEKAAAIIEGPDFNSGGKTIDVGLPDGYEEMLEKAIRLRRRVAEAQGCEHSTECVCLQWQLIDTLDVDVISTPSVLGGDMIMLWAEAGGPCLFHVEALADGLQGGWDKKPYTYWAFIGRPDGDVPLG